MISIKVAARLGRDIKDPNNLTAEEREYVDKRDLIGLRIKQYINTNTIPEDEDREPAYSRKLNDFVRDLLGIKDRSKPVRMDDPKKAAKKLLEFYQGKKLKELLEYLNKGLDSSTNTHEFQSNSASDRARKKTQDDSDNGDSQLIDAATKFTPNSSSQIKTVSNNKHFDLDAGSSANNPKETKSEVARTESTSEKQFTNGKALNTLELAQRLNVIPKTINNYLNKNKNPEKFKQWTKKKDPDGIAWQKREPKIGRSNMFEPIEK
ncbi:MAG: hypothetical protein QNJ54_35810 [Prochloraceae cyanobacterium]|nr:hypothetical protein [Prochloraceae cyanobacterium]